MTSHRSMSDRQDSQWCRAWCVEVSSIYRLGKQVGMTKEKLRE